LCAGARQLGERVTVLAVGSRDRIERIIAFGADRVFYLGDTGADRTVEDYAFTLSKLIEEEAPDLFLFGATKRCRHMAGRLAARQRTSVLSDIMEFLTDKDEIQGTQMVYGGAAVRTLASKSATVFSVVGSGVFTSLPEDADREGDVRAVDFVEPAYRVRCMEKRERGGTSVDLTAAKRVIAVGRGIAKEEDLKMIEELARLIGAEIGCTRPISEGVNWMGRERYIGVSGVMFKPELYIAIGISGQIQHMVGCNQSGVIFAINTDTAAKIFSQSDYGIVGDLYTVVPVLLEKIRAAR
jgi:electron transfer flavoprotein alpha subunit